MTTRPAPKPPTAQDEITIHDVLKQRGNAAITVLQIVEKKLEAALDVVRQTLREVDNLDKNLNIVPVGREPLNELLDSIRQAMPEYKNLSDEQIMRLANEQEGNNVRQR